MTFLFVISCILFPFLNRNGPYIGRLIRDESALEQTLVLFTQFNLGLINWMPVPFIVAYLNLPLQLREGELQSLRLTKVAVAAIAAAVFGLLSWGHWILSSSGYMKLYPWYYYAMPQSYQRCDARVELQQVSLFSAAIYETQFARITYNDSAAVGPWDSNGHSSFDDVIYRSVHLNQDLCYQGFAGNTDLYGLGIRTGLYLQWLSSLLANNTLPETRQDIQKVYLVFSMAICFATVISSFSKVCIFAIEIEIMYWMYWGGFVCVFASSLCPIQLGSKSKWIKLKWTTVILFTTHALMVCHGTWFIWYGCHQIFSRMPCGTYHFFLVLLLDPSERFWHVTAFMTDLLATFAGPLLGVFPLIVLLLAAEVKHSIQPSATFQLVYPKQRPSETDQAQTTELSHSPRNTLGRRVYSSIRKIYGNHREEWSFPSHVRGGIRLVTPIDVKHRRCVTLKVILAQHV